MKKHYKKYLSLRALMLVMLTSFFAFSANAQIAIDQSPNPGDFHYTNGPDTVLIDTTGTDFANGTVFYLYAKPIGDPNFPFEDSEIIDQGTDTAFLFNWNYLNGDPHNYYVVSGRNRGSNEVVNFDESEVSIPGQTFNPGGIYAGTYEMNGPGFRRLTTSPVAELDGTTPASLFVNLRLGDVSPNDSLLVEFSADGNTWVQLQDTEDSTYFANNYLTASDFVSLEFELTGSANASGNIFRIRQTRSDFVQDEDSWFVDSDNLRVEIGNETYGAPVFVNTYTVENPVTNINFILDSAGNGIGTLYAGQPIEIDVNFTGFEDQSADYEYTAVFRNDGIAFRLLNEDVSGINQTDNGNGQFVGNFTIEGDIPTNIELNENWSVTIEAYNGTNPIAGSFFQFIDVADGDELFTFEGGFKVTGGGDITRVQFDGDMDRFLITDELNIESVSNGFMIFNLTKRSSGLAPAGTEIVVEYTTDGSTFTQIGNPISLNDTLNSDREIDLSAIAGLVSSSTQFRFRQLSNNGLDLDTWSLDYFVIGTEGTLLFDGDPVEYTSQNRNINAPIIDLDPAEVPDDLIYPGDELELTYNIFPGAFEAGTTIMAILEGDDIDYMVGTSTNIVSGEDVDNTITITIPPIVGGDYSVYLQTMSGGESNSITVPVFNTEVEITELASDNGITDNGVDIIYPGDVVTASYDITGNIGTGAELFFEVLDYGPTDDSDDDVWVILNSETGAGIDGDIAGTLPTNINFDDFGDDDPIVRVRIGNGLLAETSTAFAVDLKDNDINGSGIQTTNPNNDFYIFDVFDEATLTGVDPNDIGNFISSSTRSIQTIPFEMPFGGSIQVWFNNVSFDFNQEVLLQASNDGGETFTTIFEDEYDGSFLQTNDGDQTELPSSLWGEEVVFRVIYNEDGAAGEFENELEINNIVVLVNEFTEASTDEFNFAGQFRRPRITLENLDDTDFIVGEMVEVEYTTEGTFPANTEFALVFIGERDDEDYGEVVTTSSDLGFGTFSFMVPIYAFDFDGTDQTAPFEIWDEFDVVAYDATGGADFELDVTISVDEDDDFLVIEGTNDNDGEYEFDQPGNRSLLTQAYDLSSADAVTLEFYFEFDGNAMSNILTIPQLQVSIDAGATFQNIAVDEESMLGDGYLFMNGMTYEVEVPSEYITDATHFRWYQALNLGEDEDVWYVEDIELTLSTGNEISTFYDVVNGEQGVTVAHPDLDEYVLTQVDPNDAVFNGETVELSFDKVYETTVDFPAGTSFTYLLYSNDDGEYVIDPETREPLIIGTSDAIGAFTATIPSYIENGNYDIELQATIAIDEEFEESGVYYYAGEPGEGDFVGDIDIFLRAAKTTIDFDQNDVLYAGSTVTFNLNIENAETNTDPNAEIFSNLLVVDYDGGDDLLLASEEGVVSSFTVDLPPFIREGQEFVIELSEGGPLGEPLDLIGSDNLENIENDFEDNFINGEIGYSNSFFANENDWNIRSWNGNFRFEYQIDNSTNRAVYVEFWNENGLYGRYYIANPFQFVNSNIQISRNWVPEGGDFEIRLTTLGEPTEGDVALFNAVYEDTDNNPSINITTQFDKGQFVDIPGEVYYENDNGRGLITTRDFSPMEIGDARFLEFDLLFDEVPENMLANQFLILEYSTDEGASYTELGSFPDMDEEDPIDDTFLVQLSDDIRENGARFRWRQEERAGITVALSDISFLFGSLLPFDYVSVDQDIVPQGLLVTGVSATEACLSDAFSLDFEVRGRMGANNIVMVEYSEVGSNNFVALAEEFSAFEGTGTLDVTLPSDLVSPGDDNRTYEFRLRYMDDTFENQPGFEDTYSASGPVSEAQIEIVSPILSDADFDVDDPLACVGGDVIVEVDDVQEGFMYEILDASGAVLGSTTYDSDEVDTEFINIGTLAAATTLSMRITSMSSSGALTCNTITSTETQDIEPLANFELYSNKGGTSSYRLVAAGESFDVCENSGSNDILQVGRLFADGGISYGGPLVEWFKDNVNTPVTTEAGLDVNDLIGSGSYFARITESSCIYTTEAIQINIVETPDQPTATLVSGSLEGCEAEDAPVLEGPEGFAFYQWIAPGSLNGTTTRTIEAEFSGSYSVRVSNEPFDVGCGSPYSAAIEVDRYTLPEFSIGKSNNLGNVGAVILDGDVIDACESGQTIWFFDETTNTAAGGTIEIIRDGASIGFTTNANITLDESGVYSFNWMDEQLNVSCATSSVSFTLNVVETPDRPTLSTTDNLVFCEGEGTVTLTAPAGFAQYRWWRNGGIISSNDDNFDDATNSITVTDDGDYRVQTSNGNACWSEPSNTIEVSVRQLPGITNSWNQVGEVCGSGQATFEIFFTDEDLNYQLINFNTGQPEGNVVRGSDGGTIFLTTDAIDENVQYYLEVSYADGEGCPISNSDVRRTAIVDNVKLELDGNTIIANITGDYSELTWFRNGVKLRNRTGLQITVTDAAEYSIEVDFDNGCVITSNAITIGTSAEAVRTYFGELEVTPFPNPSTDVLNINMAGGPKGVYNVTLMSMSGQIVVSTTIEKIDDEQLTQLNVEALEKGIYNLRVERGGTVENFRIVKQ